MRHELQPRLVINVFQKGKTVGFGSAIIESKVLGNIEVDNIMFRLNGNGVFASMPFRVTPDKKNGGRIEDGQIVGAREYKAIVKGDGGSEIARLMAHAYSKCSTCANCKPGNNQDYRVCKESDREWQEDSHYSEINCSHYEREETPEELSFSEEIAESGLPF